MLKTFILSRNVDLHDFITLIKDAFDWIVADYYYIFLRFPVLLKQFYFHILVQITQYVIRCFKQ